MKVENLELRHQLVIASPALFGFIAGFISILASASLLAEFGVLQFGAHYFMAAFFIVIGLFCMLLGSNLTNKWIENIEAGEPDEE